MQYRYYGVGSSKLTAEEIRNEMLIRTDIKGTNAWRIAAYGGKLNIMQNIWNWANTEKHQSR